MRKRLLIAVAFGLLGPLASVSAAHADANDAKFLSTLRSEGITDHVPDDYAIQAAHAVCDNLDSGKSPKEMAAEMVDKAGMTAPRRLLRRGQHRRLLPEAPTRTLGQEVQLTCLTSRRSAP